MVKLLALLKRKPGMSRQAFKERGLLEHTRLSLQLPDGIEYRINVAVDRPPAGDGSEPLYDGTAEVWWERVAAVEAAFTTAIARIAGDDADSFGSARVHLYTEAFLIVRDGRPVQPSESRS